ncbi:hypothetical protein HNY73_020502 [Argiope bruennichi]|uniref:Spidroin N-terminal domain-containing protein n=1 Tax=Argiope bruennichi TaxID=94029 RepID=A0A8T0E706_ARGBR|nr:hypothetical protein HNY73_020502 [Argiope bruennichi]
MGWITHVFVAACFLGLSFRATSGTKQNGKDISDFNKTEKKFAKVFVNSVLHSKEFGKKGDMSFIEVTETLIKAISLLQQTEHADYTEKEALMYAFASAIAELIVDQFDDDATIGEKTKIVTDALEKAYLKTTGKPNYDLIREVKILVMIFLTLDNTTMDALFEPLFGPSQSGIEYKAQQGVNHYGKVQENFVPVQTPNFTLYYLNGTKVPPERVQSITSRYYGVRGGHPKMIPIGSVTLGKDKYSQFEQTGFQQYQGEGYAQFPQYRQGEDAQIPQYRQGEYGEFPQYRQGEDAQVPQYRQGGYGEFPQYRQEGYGEYPQYRQGYAQLPQYRQGGYVQFPQGKNSQSPQSNGQETPENEEPK